MRPVGPRKLRILDGKFQTMGWENLTAYTCTRLVASPLGWSSWWTAPTRMINLKTRMIILARKIILVKKKCFCLGRFFFFFCGLSDQKSKDDARMTAAPKRFSKPRDRMMRGWHQDDTRMTSKEQSTRLGASPQTDGHCYRMTIGWRPFFFVVSLSSWRIILMPPEL